MVFGVHCPPGVSRHYEMLKCMFIVGSEVPLLPNQAFPRGFTKRFSPGPNRAEPELSRAGRRRAGCGPTGRPTGRRRAGRGPTGRPTDRRRACCAVAFKVRCWDNIFF